MKPVVAIQARLSSNRLPGKVLLDLCGAPMLQRIWDALEALSFERVVLTSTNRSDDALAGYAGSHGIACHRGPLDDVLARYIGYLEKARPPILVRVCGDAPFLKKSWVFHALDSIAKDGEPVFVPGALHAGTSEHWMECWRDTANWHPDREHAGHDWFELNGKKIELVPDNYLMVNTPEDMEEARRRWKEKHPA